MQCQSVSSRPSSNVYSVLRKTEEKKTVDRKENGRNGVFFAVCCSLRAFKSLFISLTCEMMCQMTEKTQVMFFLTKWQILVCIRFKLALWSPLPQRLLLLFHRRRRCILSNRKLHDCLLVWLGMPWLVIAIKLRKSPSTTNANHMSCGISYTRYLTGLV